MKILDNIPFKLNTDALFKKNHIEKGTDDATEFLELADQVSEIGKPKAIYKECFIDKKGDDTIAIGEITFKSYTLRKKLDSVERIFAYVVTCGVEVNDIEISEKDFLKKYWLDSIKESLLGFGYGYLNDQISLKYKIEKKASMQPGSGDLIVWPIEQQKELFSVIGDVEGLIGVKLTDSFLMLPNKSISGIIFPTEIDFMSCQLCHRENCQSRSATFDKELWESIQND